MLKHIYIRILVTVLIIAMAVAMIACDDDKDSSGAAVELKSFGPTVLRGGELKFIGTNLNRVEAIVLPESLEIPASSFKTQSSTLITLDVPEEAVAGLVRLKTNDGNEIITKTPLGILEPITIASISPNPVRPGDIVTITGTYLNLVSTVEFGGLQQETEFEEQSRTVLKVRVPGTAQDGTVLVYDKEEVPNVIASETELKMVLPVATAMAPNPVKAGTTLTITGTNLDLAVAVAFSGNQRVDSADFQSVTETKIVLTVPDETDDGPVNIVAASTVQSEFSTPLVMVEPTIVSLVGVSDNTARNKGVIKVTGTHLDLVTGVTFGGEKNASLQDGGTETQITVEVPADAVDGTVSFSTAANKSVQSPEPLVLVVPTLTSFAPLTVKTEDEPSITIDGQDLDLVTKVIFEGGFEAPVVAATPDQFTIPVTPGSLSGAITLVTTNGTEVVSEDPLTIVPDVPEVTGPASAFIGHFVEIAGTNLDVAVEVTFPGGIKATVFGKKTETLLEVLVPVTVPPGVGKITFGTHKDEIYESPEIEFIATGVEPIADAALIINDFDETGHDLGWDNWGGNVELGNDPALALSGKYLHGTNASLSGWGWLWGCNHDQLPKKSVVADNHYLKMDVKITAPIAGDANFQMALGGSRIDLGNLGGSTPGGGWITITYDLATFDGLPEVIEKAGEWGINLSSGTVDLTGLYIDNIRFQAK